MAAVDIVVIAGEQPVQPRGGPTMNENPSVAFAIAILIPATLDR